ncbi:MAG: chromosomal replication initiator protein DnaA [Christensenella sp.]|uniref:chromosomal replication initiator protein DnaA n=1 Tax=Christensenella sp. TaxID=1935934 RepID=UPI002B1F48BB|nr:chromosomal replication initiator protein DnaA [Christensenella sp.]MEA5004373.1 chromosomal replication initiator protein DnaA [Christensenella sp.]
MSVFNILWEKTLGYLEEDLPMFQFNVWIKELKPIHEDDNTYYFEVSSPMHKNLITEKYAEQIKKTMQLAHEELYGASPANLSLLFVTPQEAANIKVNEITPEKPQPKKPMGSTLNPAYTFDSFVVGESNKFANAAALAVAQSPGHSYNPLFLYGGVGLGKTHLMHAIGNHVKKENPDAEIVYVTSETFMNELIRMIQLTNNNANIDLREQFRNKYRNVDVLLVDDIQFIAGKAVTQDEFFHTFNALHELNKQIVISSDRPPQEMEKLEERMRSRFEWGLIADIKMPDYETRVAILLKKMQVLKEQNPDILPIKNEVFHYIAQQKDASIRTLEGALQKVIMYAELHNDISSIQEIDLLIAQKALDDFFSTPTLKAITPKAVADVICSYYDIREDDLRGQKKNREIAFPRQIAMYILRDLTDLSYLKIAEFFGKKDHTTVIYAEEKIKNQIKEDIELKRIVEDIEARVKG